MLPFPDDVQPVNVFVCVICVVVPSLFKVTVYPLGAVGFAIVFVALYVPVTVCCAELPFHVPPFGFTVNVYVAPCQCAFNVLSSVIFTVSLLVICVESSINHPSNVYPVFVGVGNSPYFWSYVTCFVEGVTFPPSASNVILY